jgi:hypothetical protein
MCGRRVAETGHDDSEDDDGMNEQQISRQVQCQATAAIGIASLGTVFVLQRQTLAYMPPSVLHTGIDILA